MGDIENLPDDVGQLKHLVWDYYQQNRHLQDRVALLQAALYAPKSEKSKDLFQGILPLPLARIAEVKPKPAEVPVVEVPAHTGPSGDVSPCRTISRASRSLTICPRTRKSAPAGPA